MEAFFISLLNRSYQAAMVICIILAVRLLFRLLQVPRKYTCMLWAIPLFRLVFPFSIESIMSLLPTKEPLLPPDIGYMAKPRIVTGSAYVDVLISQALPAATPEASVNPMQVWLFVLRLIWLAGVTACLVYSMVSYICLKRKLRCSIHFGKNIFLADYIGTPFVLGILRPRIYLPSSLEAAGREYVLAHERMHIKRGDHLYKMAAFLITVLHWFNPLAWAAFALLGRDIETACDEAVMKQYGEECRKEYARTLLGCAAGRKLKGVPLAFSEGSPKERIRHILRYKKPLLGLSALAAAAVILLAAGLICNPPSAVKGNREDMQVQEGVYLLENSDFQKIVIDGETMSFSYSLISSRLPYGNYAIEGDVLTLTSMGGYQYRFRIEGDSLIFIQEGSEKLVGSGINEIPDVVDGSVFRLSGQTEPEEVTLPIGEEGEWEKTVEITQPSLTDSMPIGADGMILDYADGRTMIFHGYFGLFVCDTQSFSIIGAVDLKAIGCDATQGDDYCEVSVAKDGSKVYLSPLSGNNMYVYDVASQSLTEKPRDVSGIEMFDAFVSEIDFLEEYIGFRSVRRAVITKDDGSVAYGYLSSLEGTVGDICYEEIGYKGDNEYGYKTYPIFDALFLSSSKFAMMAVEASDTGIAFGIFNNSGDELVFSDDFRLQRWEDNKWVDVPYIIDNWAFNEPAYPVEAGGYREAENNWEWLYGKLPEGVYLFIKPVFVENEEGITERFSLGVSFSLPEDAN